jgi:hypothetical protein
MRTPAAASVRVTVAAQHLRHPPRVEERMGREQLVDPARQCQTVWQRNGPFPISTWSQKRGPLHRHRTRKQSQSRLTKIFHTASSNLAIIFVIILDM